MFTLVVRLEACSAVKAGVAAPLRRRLERRYQLAARVVELPARLGKRETRAQLVAEVVIEVILGSVHRPGRCLPGADALDLGRAHIIPEGEVEEVVLHRPAVDRRLAELLVRQSFNRGE